MGEISETVETCVAGLDGFVKISLLVLKEDIKGEEKWRKKSGGNLMLVEQCVVWDEALSRSGVCFYLSSVEENMSDAEKFK